MKNLDELMKQNKKVGTWGIPYLDYKISGIYQGQLYLVGARSGAGKSTIAETVALHNADNGIKTTLISLENFEGDMELKMGYYFYKEYTHSWALSIYDWVSGNFDKEIEAFKKTQEYIEKRMENINLITRPYNGFTVKDLKEVLTDSKVNQHSEMVIIDHLDYFDKTGKESDNEHISELVSEIRSAQYALKMPVIAISHLRKLGDKNCKIPSQEEFIGSSNKTKQSTVVIVLAPDDETNEKRVGMTESNLRSTYCSVRKNRFKGMDNTTGRIEYDSNTGKYTDFWVEYSVSFDGNRIGDTPINTSKKYGG